ncbi:putative zinc finger BED domain-containing protein RICESLEEPER [Sesbania bispinosa]|nr:putative zinc finger BED domain-containing protein RICESLEEPER [Sesbania bispinosa]
MRGKQKGQPVLLTKMTQGRPELVAASYDPDNARKELGCAIIMHDYPLSIVGHIGFRRYSAALQPLFSSSLSKHYQEEILKFMNVRNQLFRRCWILMMEELPLHQICGQQEIRRRDIWQSLHTVLMALGLYKVLF